MKRLLMALVIFLGLLGCKQEKNASVDKTVMVSDTVENEPITRTPFVWEGANIYFLLTDRFNNANRENDVNYKRTDSTGTLRGFMGGDIQGITQKINEGYFSDLGINAIWFTPVVEQVHGDTDEGSGKTYGYHGYWAKDWTALDPNFGTKKDLEELIKTAHRNGIRILMDVVMNHTGPVTDEDPVWPEQWVRTAPVCEFTDYMNTTECTLVENLPDIRTESEEFVEIPDALLAKWKKEGRLSQELDEIQLFFERTGFPRAPRYYIIKWLTDYVNSYGIDGFRVDTVKHVNENAWADLYKEASYAFETWKKMHPKEILDQNPFYMVGEVYGYGVSSGREYDFGDKKVDYFNYGFKSLINFELKTEANTNYQTIFNKYSKLLSSELQGKSVVNYLSSHDDGSPYDLQREHPIRAANVLLLTPGASQIYYGDETARDLAAEGPLENPVVGDASLRSFMNWKELDSIPNKKNILSHWQKLGQFRHDHPAVGAGVHRRLHKNPYVFGRTYMDGEFKDKVAVGLDLPKGKKSLVVKGFFGDGTKLHDTYSDTIVTVRKGSVVLDNDFEIALLELAP